MNKEIFKDKFIVYLLLAFFYLIYTWIRLGDWFITLIYFLFFLVFGGFVGFFKDDFYLLHYTFQDDMLQIQYQRNFKRNQIRTITINPKAVDSLKFESKGFLNSFNIITIRYVKENELYDKITIKIKNEEFFNSILFQLNQKK